MALFPSILECCRIINHEGSAVLLQGEFLLDGGLEAQGQELPLRA